MKILNGNFKELGSKGTRSKRIKYLLDCVYETQDGFTMLVLRAGKDEMDVAPSEDGGTYIVDDFSGEGYGDEEYDYADTLEMIDDFLDKHNDDVKVSISAESDVAL